MRYQSFLYALQGIGEAVRSGRNFRVMIISFVLVIAAAASFSVNLAEWAVILVCCGGAFALELMNTAIEKAIDLATQHPHPLAKMAKDMAAGAVLLWCVFSAIAGFMIFIPHIVSMVSEYAKY